jgi:predicted MFS family arabinose efflux permease
MQTRTIDRNFLAINFLLDLSPAFFFATYQLFLLDKGLDLFQVNLINVFFMAGNFLMEMPTGAVADLFGRKRSVQLGAVALAGSFLAYYFAPSFWYFVLAELIGALGATLVSGALEAWFVDARKKCCDNSDIDTVFARQGQWSQVAVMIGAAIGGQFGARNLGYPWLASAVFGVIALIAASFLMQEESRAKIRSPRHWSLRPIVTIIKVSIEYGLKHRGVMRLVTLSFIFSCAIMGFNMQWPAVFKGFGVSVDKLGLVMSAISASLWLGARMIPRLKRSFKHEFNALVFSQVLTAVTMLIASLMLGGLTTFIFFLAHEVGRGMFRPLKQDLLNRMISHDRHRATILSFESMVGNSGAVCGLLLTGWLAKQFSVGAAWFISGVVLTAGFAIIFWRNTAEQTEEAVEGGAVATLDKDAVS